MSRLTRRGRADAQALMLSSKHSPSERNFVGGGGEGRGSPVSLSWEDFGLLCGFIRNREKRLVPVTVILGEYVRERRRKQTGQWSLDWLIDTQRDAVGNVTDFTGNTVR